MYVHTYNTIPWRIKHGDNPYMLALFLFPSAIRRILAAPATFTLTATSAFSGTVPSTPPLLVTLTRIRPRWMPWLFRESGVMVRLAGKIKFYTLHHIPNYSLPSGRLKDK